MLGKIITAATGFFSQGVGHKVGASTANIAAWAAFIATLYPIWKWFESGGKNQILFELKFTVGESLFLSLIFFVIIKVIHYTRPGNPQQRNYSNPTGYRIPTDE